MNFKPSIRDFIQHVALSLCFGIIYICVTKFSLLISDTPGQNSAFYISSGFAIGITIIFGVRYLPGLILAKIIYGLLHNWVTTRIIFSSMASGCEIFIAYYLYQSFKNSIDEYFEYQSKLVLVLMIGLMAPILSALIGVTGMYVTQVIDEQSYFANFITWYSGDFLGILIFLPAFIDFRNSKHKIFDLISPFIALAITYIFKFQFMGPYLFVLFVTLLIPLTLGTIFGVYYSLIAVAICLNWFLINHAGPFSLGNYSDNLLSMQFFLFAISLNALALEGFRKTKLFKNALIPLLTFWLLTGSVYYYYHSQRDLSNEKLMTGVMDDFENHLLDKMHIYENALKGAAGFVTGSKDVQEEEWYEYVKSIAAIDPANGILGIGIIYPQNNKLPIRTYIYPESLNEHKQIENIFSNPQLSGVFQPYLYGHNPILSTAIKFDYQGKEHQVSFLIMPVQKSFNLTAWIVIPIEMSSFFKSVIEPKFKAIDIDIYDSEYNLEQKQIYSKVIDSRMRLAPRPYNRISILVLANHTFTVDWNETLRYITVHSAQNTLTIFIGAVFSILFTGFFLNLKLLSVKANKIADSKTYELRESEEKFKSLFENSSDAVILFNNDEIIDCNPESIELFGKHSKKELLRTPLLNFFSIRDIDNHGNKELFEYKVREVRYKKMVKFECMFPRVGVPFYAEMHLHYIAVNDKFIFQAVVRDISERKKIEQNLTKSKELAEDAARTKSNFLSTMSHEIRTPLNGVIGMINIILDENPKSEIREDLETIKYSADNLLHIVNEVLDYNKIESGKIVLEKKFFSLKNLCENILKIHRPKALEKQLNLAMEFDAKIPDLVIGDEYRNNQILNNLLGNALKFTDHGNVALNVRLKQQKQDSCIVEFKISDTGIGIDKNKQREIFKDFTQAESDHTRKYGGTGLGLAITKRLVEIQKGKIDVSSGPLGTVFTYTIFFNLNTGATMDSAPLIVQNIQTTFNGQRVLLVEDNQVNIIVTKKFLEKWGLKVDVAINGLEAIHHARAITYDLILMDLHMPLMDGFEATKKIREFNKHTPIIGLSADVMTESITTLQAIGMSDFVTKPFRPNDFFLKLKSYI
jgi:PAS domain S-box-containing protein